MGRMSYDERALRFDAVLAQAVACGDADEVLAGMLADERHDDREQVLIVAALGDAHGPAGRPALRSALARALAGLRTAGPRARSDWADLACACTWALGKRDGPAATDLLLEAALDPHPDVSHYGLDVLAAVGDDRGWDDMFARLGSLTQQKSRSARRDYDVACIIEYLGRHAPLGSNRALRLVTLVRDRWRNIGMRERVEQWWPGMEPGGLPRETIDLAAHVVRPPWAPPLRDAELRERRGSGSPGRVSGDEDGLETGKQPADGIERQQPAGADEAWERLAGDPGARDVEVSPVEEAGGWQVFVAAMEFVREAPLESELRRRIAAALRAVEGVGSAEEEDREVWFVTGTPSGDALLRAAQQAVDDIAAQAHRYTEG
jgi:hypothetical protein